MLCCAKDEEPLPITFRNITQANLIGEEQDSKERKAAAEIKAPQPHFRIYL